MIISSLFNIQVGSEVTIIGNTAGHAYTIGLKAIVSFINNNQYQLLVDGNPGGTWANLVDLQLIKINKAEIINELSDMLEFFNDWNSDNIDNIDKEFKVYKILKEVKATKSDMEKIAVISKYL